jgi:hypothetical protein
MKKSVKRSKDNTHLFIKCKGKIIKASIRKVCSPSHTEDVMRFRKKEFSLLKKNKIITHFNLQSTGYKKGKKYLLVLIVKPGFFDGKNEQQPVLSLDDAFIATCISVQNHVPYGKIEAGDFRNSFLHIKNIGQLKKIILQRYSQSMPHIKPKEILSLGVGITRLRVEGKVQ